MALYNKMPYSHDLNSASSRIQTWDLVFRSTRPPRHFLWVSINKIISWLEHALGPVVQSVISLTSLLRVILLTVLADSIYNILIFFAEKATHIFSAKNFSIFAYHSM